MGGCEAAVLCAMKRPRAAPGRKTAEEEGREVMEGAGEGWERLVEEGPQGLGGLVFSPSLSHPDMHLPAQAGSADP